MPTVRYARLANASMFQLSALARPLWCGGGQVPRPTKQWTCECGDLWYLCTRHGNPPAKVPKTVRPTIPQSKFMDNATEQKQLIKLDNAKCTPKYSQASAVETRQCLRRIRGCRADRAEVKGNTSTVSIEFKNRRREQLGFIAVEGLDPKGVRDNTRSIPRPKPPVQTG